MGELSLAEVCLRLGLASAIGLILGFEREQHGRAAGMRTTMLVCVAGAVVMVLSQHLFWEASQGVANWRPDPARLAAGVLAGMGFLGAGVILRQDHVIHGVTTAAVLWFASILGMSFGAGYLLLGLAGFVIVVVALFILPKAEARILSDRFAMLSVTTLNNGPSQEAIKKAVESLGLGAQLRPIGLEIDNEKKRRVLNFDIVIKNNQLAQCQAAAVNLISGMRGVLSAQWE